jgi:phosphoglycerol transferase MdoB-like AlkP superfamily enzyme
MVSYPQYPPQEPSQGGNIPPTQQPLQQPMPQYYPKVKIGITELFNDSIVILFILLSLLLMWIGTVFYAANIGSANNTLLEVAVIIYSLGTTFLSFILLIIPLIRKEMDRWVRVAFILSAVVIIAVAYIRFV